MNGLGPDVLNDKGWQGSQEWVWARNSWRGSLGRGRQSGGIHQLRFREILCCATEFCVSPSYLLHTPDSELAQDSFGNAHKTTELEAGDLPTYSTLCPSNNYVHVAQRRPILEHHSGKLFSHAHANTADEHMTI